MNMEDRKKWEDKVPPVAKMLQGAIAGLAAGSLSYVDADDVPNVKSNVALRGLIRLGKHGAAFAAIGAITGAFIGVEQLMQHYRKKRDYVHGAVGGYVVATMMGRKGGEFSSFLILTASLPVALMYMSTARRMSESDEGKE